MGEKDTKDLQVQANLAKIKHRIVVMSGKGGVGKSFVAVNLAFGLALQGKKVGILDVDVHGPSIAKLTNIEGKPIEANPESGLPMPIKVATNVYALTVASMISSDDSPLIWRGPLKMALIKQFFSDFDWPELDYLVVDCPPGTGDEPLSVFQTLGSVDGTVIVTTPQDVAILDVKKSVSFAEQLKVPILGIIENMKYFRCPNCDEQTAIFKGNQLDKLLSDHSIERLAELEMDPRIAQTSDEGKPYIYHYNGLPSAIALMKAVENIIDQVEENAAISEM